MAAARRAKQKTADEVNFYGQFRIESELILDFLILEDTQPNDIMGRIS